MWKGTGSCQWIHSHPETAGTRGGSEQSGRLSVNSQKQASRFIPLQFAVSVWGRKAGQLRPHCDSRNLLTPIVPPESCDFLVPQESGREPQHLASAQPMDLGGAKGVGGEGVAVMGHSCRCCVCVKQTVHFLCNTYVCTCVCTCVSLTNGQECQEVKFT